MNGTWSGIRQMSPSEPAFPAPLHLTECAGVKMPELLLPAGSPEILRAVLSFGADAAYLGGEALSLREKARNFSSEELRGGLRFAHSLGKKIYLAVNILAHNEDLAEAERCFRELAEEYGFPKGEKDDFADSLKSERAAAQYKYSRYCHWRERCRILECSGETAVSFEQEEMRREQEKGKNQE